jgi:hypothetical protein
MGEMRTRLLMPLLALLLAAAAPPLPPALNDPNTTEGWIWQQVQAGRNADLNGRCGTPALDVRMTDDDRWRSACRRVDPVQLRALLTQPDLADRTPHGVAIRGAYIDGNLNLDDARVRAVEVSIEECWLAGDLVLTDAHLDGVLDLDRALITGQINSLNAFVSNRLTLNHTLVHGDFDGNSMRIGKYILMRGAEFGGSVLLQAARIEDLMDMEGASIAKDKTFDARGLHVGRGGLIIREVTFGGPVDLGDAQVDGELAMNRASVAQNQTFRAQELRVGAGGLSISNVAFGGRVDLLNAHVDGRMEMIDAKFASRLDAEALHVGGNFFARSVTFGGAVNFRVLVVDGTLDLRDSHVRRLDLAGAVVRDDLLLGGRYDDGSEHWLRWDYCDVGGPRLSLRNARVGNLQDDDLAWPPHITLQGFAYTHLGGFGGERRQDMRNRSVAWWRDWLKRDPVYGAQPYAQLAGVLAAAGNRDGAADIRFFGRDRERSELLRGCTWLQEIGLVDEPDDDRPCSWGTGLGLSALQLFVGHGIGAYTFRAAGWVLVLALVGAIILCFAPGVRGVRPVRFLTKARRGPRQKSLLWCFGASLQRVLPLVTISAEFSDFFNDPRRERLRSWQHVAFGVLVLCGWALAGFVAAAFSGLIQT